MASMNEQLYRLVVDRLQVGLEDRALEIGFGHGRAIALLTARAARGFVAGVDLSETMRSQAARFNRAEIAAGRVALHRASVEHVPYPDASFERACATNCLHHWPDRLAGLRELRRVLAPGSRLVLGVRRHEPDRSRFSPPGLRPEQLEAVAAELAQVDFRDVQVEQHDVGRAVCLLIATG